ncbi:MAG: DNA-3-methyladenine glycosylase [Leifsonia sp.]
MKPRKSPLPDRALARGPACVAQSFGANLTNDGDDLFGGQWQFFAPEDGAVLPHMTGPRVGVSGPGGDAKTFPWRYWLSEESSVSTYKPGRAQPGAASGARLGSLSAVAARKSIMTTRLEA